MYLEFYFFPYAFLAGVVLLIALLPVVWRQKHRLTYLICFSLFWVYVLLVLGVMFFPIRLPDDWPAKHRRAKRTWTLSPVNLIPFKFGDLFSASPDVITRNWLEISCSPCPLASVCRSSFASRPGACSGSP